MTYTFKQVASYIHATYPDMYQLVVDMLNPLVDFHVYEYEMNFDVVKMHYLVCARILSRHTPQYRDCLDIIVGRKLSERRDLIDVNILRKYDVCVPDVEKMLNDGNYNIKQLGYHILMTSRPCEIEHYINIVTPVIDRWNQIKESGKADVVWTSTGATSGHKQLERQGIIKEFIQLCKPYMTLGIEERKRVAPEVKRVKAATSTVSTTDTAASTVKRVMNRMQGKSGFMPTGEMIARMKQYLPSHFTDVHTVSKMLVSKQDAARRDEVWSIVNAMYGVNFVNFQGRDDEVLNRYNMSTQILREKKSELNLTNISTQYRLYMICRDLGLNIPRTMFDFADETAKMVSTWETIKHHMKW